MAGEQIRDDVAVRPRKRAAIIRPIYLSLLLIIGLAAAVEITSARSHSATVESLEAAMREARFVRNEPGVPGGDIAKHIAGVPFTTEEPIEGSEKPSRLRKRYWWPSLIGHYQIAVTFDDQNRAIALFENISPKEDAAQVGAAKGADKPQPAKPADLPPPKEGLAETPPGTVVLDTNEPAIVGTMMKRRCGSIYREIFRQMVLVAARDEMGLGTLDASLSEVPFVSESPSAYALQVDLRLTSDPKEPGQGKLMVELRRADASGNWFRWSSTPVNVSNDPGLDELLASFEPLTRGELIEGLTKAGFEKSTATIEPPVELPKSLSNRMDFVAQFAQVRHLHAVRRATGETIENLGGLVRAYANLGNLIDFHWGPMSKAFKARAAVYAQRMVAKYGATPETLAHRAYVWALMGIQAYGSRDLETAQSLQGGTLPEWFPFVQAYCEYIPENLDDIEGNQNELARYLLMRMLHPAYEREIAVPVINEVLQRNPACTRVLRQMRDGNSLGLIRRASEGLAETCWQGIAQRLKEIPDLPAGVEPGARRQAAPGLLKMLGIAAEPQSTKLSREKLIKSLRSEVESGATASQPSWVVMSEMLHDFAFFEAEQDITSMAQWLGLPPAQIDRDLAEYGWLIKSHRYGKYLLSFGSDRPAKLAGLTELYRSVRATDYEIEAENLGRAAYEANPDFYIQIYRHIDTHWDKLYDEMLHVVSAPVKDWQDVAWNAIVKFSPRYPFAIARTFHKDPEFNDEKAKELEKRFANNGYLLWQLGQKYRDLGRREDATRCFTKSFKVAPTHDNAFDLAWEYELAEQTDAAIEVLEKALQIPSYGLENGDTHRKIAYLLMRKGRWDEAVPHAQDTAATYSARGLICASRCAEGREEWDHAERFIQLMSERYESSADDWYFWCIRTGTGSIDKARALAEKGWSKFVEPYHSGAIWSLASKKIVDGDLEGAIATLTNANSVHHHNAGHYMMAGILADRLGDEVKRDEYFSQLEKRFSNDGTRMGLVNLFWRALKDVGNFQWDQKSFEEFSDSLSGDDIIQVYYFAGEFLRLHGEEKTGDEYIRVAATAFGVTHTECMLANFSLRSRGLDVPKTRLDYHPSERLPFLTHQWKARSEWQESRYDKAREEYDAAIAINPEFVNGMLGRARLDEGTGRIEDAIAGYQKALTVNPNCEIAHERLAFILAFHHDEKIRDSGKALAHAQKRFELCHFPMGEENCCMAAALAASGDYTKAVEFQERSVKFEPKNKLLQTQLELYKAEKPYRWAAPDAAPGEKKD